MELGSTALILLLALPTLAALLAPLAHRALGGAAGWLLAAIPVVSAAWLVSALPLDPQNPIALTVPWAPQLGVEFALRLDGLSLLFALMITGIGALIIIYANGYLAGDSKLPRLHAYLFAFMAAMLGVVIADDLITLFVFWELTSITSFLLIGFKHESSDSRKAALQALLVTGAGGLALLAGLVLLALAAVSSGATFAEAGRISALANYPLADSALYPAAVCLIVVGCFTKSAQVPFHFWLPGAMAAPTPVSAYLHSATMVKAGVFLLARFTPALGDTALWHTLVTTGGATTMLVAALLAAAHTDLKRILAFSTVAVLGTLVMLIGVGTEKAITAAVVFLAAHALYKAALFMVAGNIDHATGTRDVTKLGGLVRFMPITAAAGLIAALSKAGAPPMFGFIGKELLLKAQLNLDTLTAWLVVLAALANVFLIAMALVVAFWPFFSKRKQDTPREPHEVPISMLLGPVLLAALGLFVGFMPGVFDEHLGPAAASAIAGEALKMELKLWHGVNPIALGALAISAVTLLLGTFLAVKLKYWLVPAMHRVDQIAEFGPERAYQRALDGLYEGAAGLTNRIQTGRLRSYLLVIVIFTTLAIAYPLFGALHWPVAAGGIFIHELILAALVVAGALVAALARGRLTAVAGLGVTGMSIALLFALYSAPDLALTLIMVETLTVILFVFVFYHLPQFKRLRPPAVRMRDALVAIAAGSAITLLVLATFAVRLPADVSAYFAENAATKAYGRNIVNVILVDFRAFDTLGEIVVVAIAGVGVWSLLRLRSRHTAPAPDRPAGLAAPNPADPEDAL